MKNILYSNMANSLTGIRIIATLIIIILTENMRYAPASRCGLYILCLIVICGSDYLDGRVARKFNISGDFGAVFDVMADVLYVFAAHIQLVIYGICPMWLLVLIFEKIVNYVLTSTLVSHRTKGKFTFIRDPIGRVVSAIYFITPTAMLLSWQLGISWIQAIIHTFIFAVAIMGIVSSIYRYIYLIQIDKTYSEV